MQNQAIERASSNEQPRGKKSQENALWNRIKNQFAAKSPDKEQSSSRKTRAAPLIYVANAPDTDAMHTNGRTRRQSSNRTDEAYLSPEHASGSPRISKSDQMLSRLLKDQLQLAYSDHQNNVRCAQSHAALQQLRNSQPRLEITPVSSRHASPSRHASSSRHTSPGRYESSSRHASSNRLASPGRLSPPSKSRSPSMTRRRQSPARQKFNEATGSSGSEKSYSSNKSAPPSYQQLAQPKSDKPSRRRSSRTTHSVSQSNSPRQSPMRSGMPAKQFHHSNGGGGGFPGSGASELVKHAHINLIWAFILDAVKTANLDHFDTGDPKQWWRKLFQTLKLMYGKAKASSIAGQLMGNPMVLDAIQNKLAGMVGGQSGYIQSLPKSVQRRIKALKKLQFECTKIEAEFYEEIHKLECKFADRYTPIFHKRKEIITGDYEPNDDECDWPSDSEDEDEDEEDKPPKIEPDEEPEEGTKGIASFWPTTFRNVEIISSMVQEHDEPILESLTDIKIQFSSEPMGFTLNFEFAENDYFTDKVLTKQYHMRSTPDENDPFGFEGPEIVSCKGCTVHWKDGKNVTVINMKKKQKNAKTGVIRTVTKAVQNDSFFNFFSPPEVPEDDDLDEDTESLLQADYQIGHFLRERVVPHAVLYFTGEAMEEDEDDDEDDEEGDEYDEDDDPDYDPSKDPSAAQAKDCKQQ